MVASIHSSNIKIMGILPYGIISHLADLAPLDRAGSRIWVKTFKIKEGSQYTGDVKGCVCIYRCVQKKKLRFIQPCRLKINVNVLCADIHRMVALKLKKSFICRTSQSLSITPPPIKARKS